MTGDRDVMSGAAPAGQLALPPTVFYDSARPWLIPPAATHAMLYLDGRYAAPPSRAGQFEHVRWITVAGDPEAGAADFEPGNEIWSGPALRKWVTGRAGLGYRARVYTDRANVRMAFAAVGDLPNVLWWVATLDGLRTPAVLLRELVGRFGVDIEPRKLWAIQYAGGETADYDTNLLTGDW